MFNAYNGLADVCGGTVDYIRFGTGPRTLVMIPGVGDGLKTVKGMALPFAMMYKAMAKDFTVYVFSRRRELAAGTSTRKMAEDLAAAMDLLGLKKAAVVGVSQGGMIAQWLAIDRPDLAGKLVLTVTLCRPNPTVTEVVGRWIEMAGRGEYKAIMLDTAERSYSPKRLKQARITNSLIGEFGKPKSFDRFIIQAESCLNHNAYAELARISCPTLVIGGEKDAIVTGDASREIASLIPGARLYMYGSLSHGLYEEAPDFIDRVISFCK